MRTTRVVIVIIAVFAAIVGCAGASGDDDDGRDGGGPGDGDGGPGDGDGGQYGGDIDFSNNLLPSPMPPGNLAPANAPQIIVFGWDDLAFTGDHANDLAAAPDNGMNFIVSTFGNITNPDGSRGSVSFYQNGAYLPNSEQGGPWGSETNLMLAASQELLAAGFEPGNHTFDHLEINGTWGKIPSQWRTGSLGGWAEQVGTKLDQTTWMDPVISFNDSLLRTTYSISGPALHGFRAPRLEINDDGLQALAASGYTYETNMEEGHQWEYVAVATTTGAATDGFKWVVWPHTLDNGSPGAWQSQDFGEKNYLVDFPRGLWEVPVYMVYVPDNGLQQTIADRMRAEITSEPTDWVGDRVREITAFDFNTFLYARMTQAEWVQVMKHTFLTRYNGNRAPITFGAHPGEFSARYDVEVLGQANNVDFLDVLQYNTYAIRKAAVREFVDWVRTNYPDDVYFMSGGELVDYMKNPFDKDGNPVGADPVASPHAEDLFSRLPEWTVNADTFGSSATVSVDGPGALTVDFTVGTANAEAEQYPFVDVATYFEAGALSDVSHIDIVYEAEAPFRLRLLTGESSNLVPMQVLLAGVGGERAARIRIKDFRPDPYTAPAAIAAAGFVDASYMSDVIGLSFESAATSDQTSFRVRIKRIIVHGMGAVSARPAPPRAHRVLRARGTGSAARWPRHEELH